MRPFRTDKYLTVEDLRIVGVEQGGSIAILGGGRGRIGVTEGVGRCWIGVIARGKEGGMMFDVIGAFGEEKGGQAVERCISSGN